MTDKQLDILVNIIGGVESGGQQYGNRRYDAYAAPYTNSPEEHTITLGWCQFYGHNARELCKRIFDEDKNLFRKNDTANIEKRLTQDWVALRWNPSSKEKSALLKIISTSVGKKIQDEMFKEDMKVFIKDAETFGITDVGAQMMYCEIRHLGGKSPTERIFKRAKKPYTADTVYASLLLDQNDTSNSNQVGDKKYQSRHQKCVEWIHEYVDNSTVNKEGDNVTKDEAIKKVISIAEAELDYLEKKSNSQLDSKTANAGSANYTKYWRDVYPDYQGQPWCACFVTWCLDKAFGRAMSKKLLKHYPFVYCPTLGSLHTKNANPKIGDIVLFYRGGVFAHTGFVTNVSGDRFWTIEGNASTAPGITPNGGGVVSKSYYNTQLPGTKFITLDWDLVSSLSSSTSTVEKPVNKPTTNTSSSSIDNIIDWTGITTDLLNVRTWAGSSYPTCSFSPLPKGAEIGVCDVVQASDGVDWYFIEYKGKRGFVSSKYVKRKEGEKESTTSAPIKTTYTQKEFIKDVQKAIGVDDDGVYGPITASALPVLSTSKNRGHKAVKYLQKYLNAIGYNVGKVDQDFGNLTKGAVMAFQEDNGLAADGIVGKNTWATMMR